MLIRYGDARFSLHNFFYRNPYVDRIRCVCVDKFYLFHNSAVCRPGCTKLSLGLCHSNGDDIGSGIIRITMLCAFHFRDLVVIRSFLLKGKFKFAFPFSGSSLCGNQCIRETAWVCYIIWSHAETEIRIF